MWRSIVSTARTDPVEQARVVTLIFAGLRKARAAARSP